MEERGAMPEVVDESVASMMCQMHCSLAVMEATMVTKADLVEAKWSIIRWTIGALFVSQLIPYLCSCNC